MGPVFRIRNIKRMRICLVYKTDVGGGLPKILRLKERQKGCPQPPSDRPMVRHKPTDGGTEVVSILFLCPLPRKFSQRIITLVCARERYIWKKIRCLKHGRRWGWGTLVSLVHHSVWVRIVDYGH